MKNGKAKSYPVALEYGEEKISAHVDAFFISLTMPLANWVALYSVPKYFTVSIF